MNKPRTLAEILALTTVKNDCLEWAGYKNKHGYGMIFHHGKLHTTHRLVYKLFHNIVLSPESCVCHTCDNRKCINIKHLFLGSVQDNIDDRENKCRGVIPDNNGTNNGQAKLTEYNVQVLRVLSKYATRSFLSVKLKIKYSTLTAILGGYTWRQLEQPSQELENEILAKYNNIFGKNWGSYHEVKNPDGLKEVKI